MDDLILYIMQLPETSEMRHLSECFNVYTKAFQNMFAVGGTEWLQESWKEALCQEERKERKTESLEM